MLVKGPKGRRTLIVSTPGGGEKVGMKDKSFTNPKFLLRPAKLVVKVSFSYVSFFHHNCVVALMNQNFTLVVGVIPSYTHFVSMFTAPGTMGASHRGAQPLCSVLFVILERFNQ